MDQTSIVGLRPAGPLGNRAYTPRWTVTTVVGSCTFQRAWDEIWVITLPASYSCDRYEPENRIVVE